MALYDPKMYTKLLKKRKKEEEKKQHTLTQHNFEILIYFISKSILF